MSIVHSSPTTSSGTGAIGDYTLVPEHRELQGFVSDTLDEHDVAIETSLSTTEAPKETTISTNSDIGVDNTVTAELTSVLRSPIPQIELPAVELGRPISHEPVIGQDQQHNQDTEKFPALTAPLERTFHSLHEPQEHEELQLGNTVSPCPTFEDIQGYPISLPSWSTPTSTSVQLVAATSKEPQTTIPRSGLEKLDGLITNLVLSEVNQISDESVEPESALVQPSYIEGQKKKSKRVRRKEAKLRRLLQDTSGPSAGMVQTPSTAGEQYEVSTSIAEPFVEQVSVLVPVTTSYINGAATSFVHEEGSVDVELAGRTGGGEHTHTSDSVNLAE